MPIKFQPSRCEGVSGVTEVVVFTDRIGLQLGSERVTHEFSQLAKPSSWLTNLLRKGLSTPVHIGERDWFQKPVDRFFRFYSHPPVTIFMPETDTSAGETFCMIRDVIQNGGYSTWDLG